MLLYICRRQYTLPSRKKCNHAIGVAGIGWTKDFRNKFNDLDDSFNKDRSSWGVTFSNALMNVFLERQCVVKANPTRPNARPASHELIWDGLIDTFCRNALQDCLFQFRMIWSYLYCTLYISKSQYCQTVMCGIVQMQCCSTTHVMWYHYYHHKIRKYLQQNHTLSMQLVGIMDSSNCDICFNDTAAFRIQNSRNNV